VGRDSAVLVCPVTAPAGHSGALAVVGNRPSFVDTTADALLAIDGDHFGMPVALAVDLPADSQVADADAGGRLAVIDPSHAELVLADTAGQGAALAAPSPIRVALGPGRFGSPVAARDAVMVMNETAGTLLTYDLGGRRQAEVKVTEPGGRVTVVRGEDGLVYVDDEEGTRTHVVDRGGVVSTVPTSEPDVPTAPPPPLSPPVVSQPPAPPDKPAAPALPGAPAGVQAQPGDARVAVSWGAANANGSAITTYHVSWTAIRGGGANGATTVPGNRRTTVLTGLRNGATYRITVVAENGVGRGPGADSPPVTPTSDVPGSATNVLAAANPDGSVGLAWQTADGQGRQIQHYTVAAIGADGSTTQVAGTPATSATVTGGLTLGTSYTFAVTAVNDVGVAGPASSPSNAVRPFGPAAAPGGFTARGTDRAVDLSWTAPNLRGGELVHYAVSGTGLPTQTVTGTTARFTGLTNGTTYQFQVRAVTREQGGAGGPTAQGAVSTVSGKPGTTPVVNVLSASLTGDRQVTVRVAVNDNASGAVTCHVYFNGGQRWNGACGGTQDIVVGGLSYATTYDVYATGSNSYGTGAPGSHASVRTNDPPPSIVVSKGAPVYIPPSDPNPCYDPSCARIHVSLRNFGSGPYRIECWSSNGNFATYTTSSTESEQCYFGYPGRYTWVKVGAVESNHYQWN
jgi:hypothetical protein